MGNRLRWHHRTAAACLIIFMTLHLCGCRRDAAAVPDFEKIHDTGKKKLRFFNFMYPLIKGENNRISSQREKLRTLYTQFKEGERLSWFEQKWLDNLVTEYDLENKGIDDHEQWQILLRRVDVIPPDLALTQAAIETAWGASRFVREGNNFFGEHCFTPGCGIVPDERSPGKEFEVRVFDSATDSVHSYIHNLNTHEAYRDFRLQRFKLRREGRLPDGYTLSKTLPLYSTRRQGYTGDLQDMIKENRKLIKSL